MARNKFIYCGETLLDLTGDTVTAATLLKGITAHDKAGNLITGTYENEIPSGYIKPTGNLTDSLITRASNIDQGGHKATLPAGYYVNSALTIKEWTSGTVVPNLSNGASLTIKSSVIGFTPYYAAIIALDLDGKIAGNCVIAGFGNAASSGKYFYTGNKASLSSTYALSGAWAAVTINSSGITFSGISNAKYGAFEYRWFAMR